MKKTILLILLLAAVAAQGQIPWQSKAPADHEATLNGQPTQRLDGYGATIQAYIPRLYEGAKYRFTGFVKTEIPVGRCQIVLEERNGNGEYIYSKSVEFSGTNDWQHFNLDVPIAAQVDYCCPYIVMNGDGRAWVADLDINIDGKPLPETGGRRPAAIEYPAQKDAMPQSGFEPKTKPTRRQIDNLVAACKAWGEVKYLNPAVARGKYNMDAELFRLLPDVWDGKPIEHWRGKFGTSSEEMPIWHYYYGTAFRNGPFAPRNEVDYQTIDTGIKLLGVFRLWNAVRYFAPNINLADNQEKVLRTAIANVFTEDYEKTLALMAHAMRDSHVYIGKQNRPADELRMAMFQTGKFIDGKFIVTKIYDNDSPLHIGDAITHIDGRSAAQFIKANEWQFSASNAAVMGREVGNFLPISHKDNIPMRLQLVRGGKKMAVDVPTLACEDAMDAGNAWSKTQPHEPAVRTIGDILYIDIAELEDAEEAPIEKYDKVIIDLRNQPEPDEMFFAALMPRVANVSRLNALNPQRPGEFLDQEGDFLPAGSTRPDRRIVVLVDETTQSKAEYMAMWLQDNLNVLTIGTQTAGADGNTTAVPLPGGYFMKFTGVGWFYSDGAPTQGVGIRIDEVLPRTINSIAAGTDNIIDRAVGILSARN